MKLTNKACQAAKPKDKAYKIFDGGGLYLFVTKQGSKLWRFKYRYLGKEKVFAIGAYSTVALAEARDAPQLISHRPNHWRLACARLKVVGRLILLGEHARYAAKSSAMVSKLGNASGMLRISSKAPLRRIRKSISERLALRLMT